MRGAVSDMRVPTMGRGRAAAMVAAGAVCLCAALLWGAVLTAAPSDDGGPAEAPAAASAAAGAEEGAGTAAAVPEGDGDGSWRRDLLKECLETCFSTSDYGDVARVRQDLQERYGVPADSQALTEFMPEGTGEGAGYQGGTLSLGSVEMGEVEGDPERIVAVAHLRFRNRAMVTGTAEAAVAVEARVTGTASEGRVEELTITPLG